VNEAFPNTLPKKWGTMRFTCKAVLSGYTKRDNTQVLELRAIIDRKPIGCSLGYCIDPAHFDLTKGIVKASHPNADEINQCIREAIAKAGAIFLKYKNAGQYLSTRAFRLEFIDPINTSGFTEFMAREIELRKPKVELVSHQAHLASLEKLKRFQPRVLFAEMTIEFAQRFENWLIKQSLSTNTIYKVFKHIRHYISIAQEKKLAFDVSFQKHRIKPMPPNRPSLTLEELKALFEYLDRADGAHKHVLQYFLFSCVTGLRFSDVARIKWNNIHDRMLLFVPHKTRKAKHSITVPLHDLAFYLMGEFSVGNIFKTYSNPMTNRVLKSVASAAGIKKHLIYHMSRHTFATLFLEGGGALETLKEILGHSVINTTMGYVKVSDSRKSSEVNTAFRALIAKNDTKKA
jgi:site-specific recombinase XerD